MNSPSITVLMPVYNGEKYLREAMDSILNQGFRDFEFLIINDGSTDSTGAIILSYNDPRIRYVKNEENLRLIASLNKGIKLASGKYIVRMDADDISMPGRLQAEFDFMEKNPEVALCGTWFENFSDAPGYATVKYSPDHETICLKHLYQIHLSHGTCIFRKEVLLKNNLFFNPDFSHAEDYELWSEIAEVGRLANIQQALYRVRSHGAGVSVKYADVQRKNSLRVRAINFRKLGIEMSEAELLLYQKIAQYEYEPDIKFINDAKSLLEKISSHAKTSASLSREAVVKNAGYFWFNVTYNLAGLGSEVYKIYSGSFLKLYYTPPLLQKLKFIFKAGLKQ